MGLINPRILKQALAESQAASPEQRETARLWAESIRNHSIFRQTESQIEGKFQQSIVQSLLGYESFGQAGKQTYRPKQPMGKGIADIALGDFSGEFPKIIAPFELKGADTRDLDAPMPGRNKTPVQQAWEYANAVSGPKWVLVSNMLEIRLYAFGEGQQDFERIDLSNLDEPAELAKAQLLLSAENLLGTRLADLLRESREADKEISASLYKDYKSLRGTLIEAVNVATGSADPVQAISTAQKILDRVVFIAFAEDRDLLPAKSLEQAFVSENKYNPVPVWENFKGLFRAIDNGNDALKISKYNGGLFAFDEKVDTLNLSNEICEKFKNIGAYRFDTEVGVTVLGHIFEQSVSDVEKLLAKARGEVEDVPDKTSGVKGRRKRDGIVYTPDYIAKFIVEKTLGTHVDELFRTCMKPFSKNDNMDYAALKFKKGEEEKAWVKYRLALTTLRVVDPACGSGVFLVTAFDYLKAEYDHVNKKISALRGKSDYIGDIEDVDREILSENLYGVDVNAESVEITKLSLWLKTAKKGKELDSLDHNIRVGDSLIEDSSFAYLKHGFGWNTAFPEVFASGGFDVVLGNPPYVRQELLKDMKPYLQKRFEVYHGVADLYCYFFERGLRLLKRGGRLGYISSSTFFKTSSGAALRGYLKKEAALDSVTDFGDLQIFEGVTTYPAILTMRKALADAAHTFKFWKVKTIPEGNFARAFVNAAQAYPQDKLGAGSWELESDGLRNLRNKIVGGKKTLKEVYGSPLYGIKTGLNEAFVIDRKTRDRLIAEDPKSEELLKPWLEGKDLKRWRAEGRDLFLILMPKGWTKSQINTNDEVPAWNWLLENQPAIARQLAPFTERGRKRTDQGDFWWELRACDYYGEFEKPKIFYNDIMQSPSFLLDKENHFAANTAYFVQGDEGLLSYLNSNVFWFYFTAMSPAIRGGFSRLFTQYVNQMPIPNELDESMAIKAKALSLISSVETRQTLEDNFTRRIPDLCPPEREAKLSTKLQDWWKLADFAAFRAEVKKCFKAEIPLKERSDWEDLFSSGKTQIEKLSAEIKRNEDDINAIVYKLFDLTPEEIELLKTSIGTR